jgi:modulator of FtsH protease HflK
MATPQWPQELGDDLRRLRQQFEGFNSGFIVPVVLFLLVLIVAWSSWYTIQPEETAVVQRFGQVHR